MPANTNWKYASVACGNLKLGPVVANGMFAWPCSALCPRISPGMPMKLPKNPWPEMPCQGVPKPILKAHSTHTTSTTANAANVSIMLLIDHRFCITPP